MHLQQARRIYNNEKIITEAKVFISSFMHYTKVFFITRPGMNHPLPDVRPGTNRPKPVGTSREDKSVF